MVDMNEVIFLAPAKKDLFNIGDYYAAEFGPSSAQKVIQQIEDSIRRLSIFPRSGTLTPDPDLNMQGYRMIISGEFVTIYRMIEDIVYIYHICSTQLDYISLFKS